MKHLFKYLATAMITALLFTACGGSDGDDGIQFATPDLGETRLVRQAVSPALYELAYSPAEHLLYVVSSGGSGDNAEPSRVFWLDADNLQIKGELALPTGGFGMGLDDDAGRLYLANTLDGSVTVVNTHSKQVIDVLPLVAEGSDHRFREALVDPARHRVYLPGMGASSALYVLDTQNLMLEKVIEGFGNNATGITKNADGSRVYVSTMKGELYTVNAQSLEIVSKAEPEGEVLLNLAFDERRNHVLSTDRHAEVGQDGIPVHPLNDDQLLVIDAENGQTLAHLPSDEGTLAVLMDSGRNLMYATNRDGGSVTVYDMNTRERVRTIDLPTYPNSLALDPDSGAVYVSVKNARGDPNPNESVARISFFD